MAPMNIRMNPLGGAVVVAITLCLFFYVFGLPEWVKSFSSKEERISMRELLSASVVLARRGGDRVSAIRKGELGEKVKGETKEGAKELMTQGDLQSHRAIFYGFNKAFPGLKVISEEHETQPVDLGTIPDVDKHLAEIENIVKTDQSIPKAQITVWIDPLDATQEYTENLLQYVTTMVCVAVNGQPTIGVIHNPFGNDGKGETTWAWVSFGHSENLARGKKVKSDADGEKVIISRSHKGNVVDALKEYLKGTEIVPAGGAGYKTLEVIKGNVDAYVHTTLIKKWDICAGNAIINAVEGKMTTLKEKHIDYSASTNPKNEGGLLATLEKHSSYLDKLKPIADNPSQQKKTVTTQSQNTQGNIRTDSPGGKTNVTKMSKSTQNITNKAASSSKARNR